ncbi:hypothetical protein TSAR_004008 [Trichomalopsis sarcophagae]|uniref:Large ribosomal subunit protein mL40 n=1 Tax=Trichomalopsis sarcophagae TaxID=543379 RepID=A0A232ER30_9HYME|nr:hypothetical protein TSAR_004008 [Trichomalopsis sarcophagae]
MYSTGIINAFSRLAVNNVFVPTRNISSSAPLGLNVTNVLFAEPLKKKKKMDPAIIRAKEERRKRKLEKYIRKLQKHARQLKTICEMEVPMSLKQEFGIRKRDLPALTTETLEERAALFKEWNKYKTKQHYQTLRLIDRYMFAQDKTISELKEVSEELYEAAIQIDPDLLPYSRKGPLNTAPIENFEAPDGEYQDVTKKYEGET